MQVEAPKTDVRSARLKPEFCNNARRTQGLKRFQFPLKRQNPVTIHVLGIVPMQGVSTKTGNAIASLALLALETLEAIVSGDNPSGLTTDYLINNRFSPIWSEQSAQSFAAL